MRVEGTQIVRSTVDVEVSPLIVITQIRNALYALYHMPYDSYIHNGEWVTDDDADWVIPTDRQPTAEEAAEMIAMDKAVDIVRNLFGTQ